MPDFKLISADSHVVEPPEMWVDYITPSFKDRAPRIVKDPPGFKGHYFIIEGMEPKKIVGLFNAGLSPKEVKEQQDRDPDFEECPPGAFDPKARMVDLERDGVEAEVIYTSLAFDLFRLKDAPFQEAVFAAYNTWLAEFCQTNPKHLVGLGLIPLMNVEEGIKELNRCAELGLRGGVIMASPPDGLSYSNPMYEPFWAAAADLSMPISLHILTGHADESKAEGMFKENYVRVIGIIHEIQRSFSQIMFSGVLERHPGLTIVSAENDIGWVPHFLFRADRWWEKQQYTNPTELKMTPREYALRQFYVSYQTDPVGLQLADYFGEDNYAWASDYPHGASTFPNSKEIVDEDFAGLPEIYKRKITRDNVIKLYNMDFK